MNIIFKSISNEQIGIEVIGWTRSFLPEIQDELEMVEGLDGAIHLPKPLGMQTITIKFRAFFSSDTERMQVVDKVAWWLFSRNFEKLELSDEPSIYYMAKVLDASDLTPELFTSEFEITFTCQPIKFGEHVEKELIDSNKFINNGTYDKTPLKITLTMQEYAEVFTVSVNGMEITYDMNKQPDEEERKPIDVGNIVVIDSKELEYRVNGKLKVFELSGYFSYLKQGENIITTSHLADIKVEYQEMYLFNWWSDMQ